MFSKSCLILSFLFSHAVQGQANLTGNCLSGSYTFDPLRTYAISPGGKPGSVNNRNLDVSRYDFTIDYGNTNVKRAADGSLEMQLSRNPSGPATGVRISSLRYILYGRITGRFKGIAVPGVITTFITMSDVKDEIDFEMVGHKANAIETNVFYKGIEEFGIHGGNHTLNGTIADWHTYTIDWTNTTITFSIDNTTVRTHRRDGPEGTSPRTPSGSRWFPNTPSLIQISVWDGGSSPSNGTVAWAGGPIPWNGRTVLSAFHESIIVQCYDDQMRPVEKWPADSPSRAEAQASQPTSAANANQARGSGNSTDTTSLAGLPGMNSASSLFGASHFASWVVGALVLCFSATLVF